MNEVVRSPTKILVTGDLGTCSRRIVGLVRVVGHGHSGASCCFLGSVPQREAI